METTPEQRLHRAASRGDVAAVREALLSVATLEATYVVLCRSLSKPYLFFVGVLG